MDKKRFARLKAAYPGLPDMALRRAWYLLEEGMTPEEMLSLSVRGLMRNGNIGPKTAGDLVEWAMAMAGRGPSVEVRFHDLVERAQGSGDPAAMAGMLRDMWGAVPVSERPVVEARMRGRLG